MERDPLPVQPLIKKVFRDRDWTPSDAVLVAPFGVAGLAGLAQRLVWPLQRNKDSQLWVVDDYSQELGAFSWWPPTLDLDVNVTNPKVRLVLSMKDVGKGLVLVGGRETLREQGILNLVFKARPMFFVLSLLVPAVELLKHQASISAGSSGSLTNVPPSMGSIRMESLSASSAI